MYGNRLVWIILGVIILAVDSYLIAEGLPYAAKGVLLYGEITTVILGILLLLGLFFVSYGALSEANRSAKSDSVAAKIVLPQRNLLQDYKNN